MEELIYVLTCTGIVSIIAIIILILSIIKKCIGGMVIAILYIVMFAIVETAILLDIQDEPTAIDVYRGLTELEITSVNNVVKDTVVIFKK